MTVKTTAAKLFWPFTITVLIILAMVRSHLDGDGVEYLIMTHAFVAHGSPSLTSDDFLRISDVLRGKMDPSAHALIVQVHDQLTLSRSGTPFFGFGRTPTGEIYSIHFWLYSLLAAPFYVLLSAVGAKLTWCYSLLNLTFVAGTVYHLKKAVPGALREGAIIFLALGTIYYLRWTGPEIMAACCAFSATICALRRDTSLAVLLCGIGATQNPSLALMIPFLIAHRVIASRMPSMTPLPAIERSLPVASLFIALGLLASVSSYLFYYFTFGIPSLIAPHFTDATLITARRAVSFMVDLDQGMLIGIPGLLTGALLVLLLPNKWSKGSLIFNGAWLALTSAAVAAPTLAAMNWNSGASVMLRYAYWAVMPLVAFIIAALPSLTLNRRRAVASCVLVTQAMAILASGWILRPTSFLQHTPAAHWALVTVPAFYNPDPEIFFERGRESESVPVTHTSTHLYYDGDVPKKYLRHRSNRAHDPGLCPSGSRISADSIVQVGRGWEYVNAPFKCVRLSQID